MRWAWVWVLAVAVDATVTTVPHDRLVASAGDPEDEGALVRELRHALGTDGMLVVDGVPGAERLRRDALLAAHRCVPVAEKAVRTVLKDGSKRVSVGKKSESAAARNKREEFVSSKLDECKQFNEKARLLSDLVDRVFQLVAARFETVCVPRKGTLDFENANDFGTFFNQAQSLEHFHVYSPSSSFSQSDAALGLHTDAGLLIGFVPALLVGPAETVEEHEDKGNFFFQSVSGQLEAPILPNDAVVFMVGDGFQQIFNSQVVVPLRPTPHMLVAPKLYERIWYGRMFLPPANLVVPGTKQTYSQLRQEQIKSLGVSAHSSIGCSSPTLALADQAATCPEQGEVYCWMACVKESDYGGPCPPDTDPECLHPDKTIWTPDQGHCTECSVKCVPRSTPGPTGAPTPKDSSDKFCSGMGTTMYMEGFMGAGNPDSACVVLLFKSIKLDSPTRYALGCLATFVFGVLVEGLVYVRRQVHSREKKNCATTKVKKVALYFLQLVCAYVAMLFTMTYSVWIFFAIILGLVTGHVVFNLDQPVSEFTEPCCAAVASSGEGVQEERACEPSCCEQADSSYSRLD